MTKRINKVDTQALDAALAVHHPITVKAPAKSDKKLVIKAESGEIAVKKVAKPKADKKISKADLARDIFAEMLGQPRQDILAAFQTKAGLSKAGANTYLANLRKASGLK